MSHSIPPLVTPLRPYLLLPAFNLSACAVLLPPLAPLYSALPAVSRCRVWSVFTLSTSRTLEPSLSDYSLYDCLFVTNPISRSDTLLWTNTYLQLKPIFQTKYLRTCWRDVAELHLHHSSRRSQNLFIKPWGAIRYNQCKIFQTCSAKRLSPPSGSERNDINNVNLPMTPKDWTYCELLQPVLVPTPTAASAFCCSNKV